jgi:hypothetical protein
MLSDRPWTTRLISSQNKFFASYVDSLKTVFQAKLLQQLGYGLDDSWVMDQFPAQASTFSSAQTGSGGHPLYINQLPGDISGSSSGKCIYSPVNSVISHSKFQYLTILKL